jgi:DNA-binding CsgD family transcriptional regulator
MAHQRLRWEQMRQLLHLAWEASAIPDQKEMQQHLLAGLARILRADIVLFTSSSDRRRGGLGRVTEFMDHGLSTDDRSFLTASFDRTISHPGLSLLMERRDLFSLEGVVTAARQDLLPRSDWRSSAYFAEYVRPARLDEWIYSIRLGDGSGGVHGVSLHRRLGERRFDVEDRSLLHLFQLDLARRLLRPGLPPGAVEAGRRLQPRERQVLSRLLAGDAEKEIAVRLDLTPNTVHQYVKAVYRACGVSSRPQLLARYLGGPR